VGRGGVLHEVGVVREAARQMALDTVMSSAVTARKFTVFGGGARASATERVSVADRGRRNPHLVGAVDAIGNGVATRGSISRSTKNVDEVVSRGGELNPGIANCVDIRQGRSNRKTGINDGSRLAGTRKVVITAVVVRTDMLPWLIGNSCFRLKRGSRKGGIDNVALSNREAQVVENAVGRKVVVRSVISRGLGAKRKTVISVVGKKIEVADRADVVGAVAVRW